MNKILVTGAAGFIGFHTVKQLIKKQYTVVGLDNLNHYYGVQLKSDRLAECGIDLKSGNPNTIISSTTTTNYRFIQQGIEDKVALFRLFENEKFDGVIHLAAQAGVRYSLKDPDVYAQSNLVGFLNILEACRQFKIKHLVYSSSSSVYGNNKKQPFSESDPVDHPINLYAASKKSNELMAHAYSHLFNLRVTGLRFFTVIGPWGRPDMALYKFTDAIVNNQPIHVYNYGEMERDFTYVDDIVEGVVKLFEHQTDSRQLYRLFNIGNNQPVKLLHFVKTIEKALNKKANIKLLPLQPGDVNKTYADTSALEKFIGYKPFTPVEEGVQRFVDWYKKYNHLS